MAVFWKKVHLFLDKLIVLDKICVSFPLTFCGEGTFVSARHAHRWQIKLFPDDSSGKALVSSCNFEILSLLWKQRSVSSLDCLKVYKS